MKKMFITVMVEDGGVVAGAAVFPTKELADEAAAKSKEALKEYERRFVEATMGRDAGMFRVSRERTEVCAWPSQDGRFYSTKQAADYFDWTEAFYRSKEIVALKELIVGDQVVEAKSFL